jgi:hypothetical protein
MPYFFGVLKGVLHERGFEVDDRPRQESGVAASILMQLRHELSRRIRPEVARRWLDHASLVEWLPDEDRCVLGLTDVEGAQKLGVEYSGLLKRTIRELAGRDIRVEVVLLGIVTETPADAPERFGEEGDGERPARSVGRRSRASAAADK